MHDRSVALLAHPLEQRPHPAVAYTHPLRRFPLGDAPRLGTLQPIQFISFLLAHRDSFHPSALRLSRGTFYLAQSGTSHLAATRDPHNPPDAQRKHYNSRRPLSSRRGRMIPMKPSPDDVTELLIAWEHGDQAALDRLMPLVYEELRRRARQYMNARGPGHTLQTTALIHEAFLKLVNQAPQALGKSDALHSSCRAGHAPDSDRSCARTRVRQAGRPGAVDVVGRWCRHLGRARLRTGGAR